MKDDLKELKAFGNFCFGFLATISLGLFIMLGVMELFK